MVCDILTLEEAKRRVCGNCIVFATLLQFKKFLKIKRKKKTRQKNFPGSLQLGPSFSIFLQWKTPGKICPHTLFLPLHLPFALPKPLWILSQMAPELAIHRIFPDLILCDLSGHVTQLTPLPGAQTLWALPMSLLQHVWICLLQYALGQSPFKLKP